MRTATPTLRHINGLDIDRLEQIAEALTHDPRGAAARFSTRTEWTGGTSARSSVESWRLGGSEKPRRFEFDADEPVELLGHGAAPNPQELLLGAVASCMAVTYAVAAATMGIEIQSLSIDMDGTLDLRGPMGLSQEVPRGFPDVECTVCLQADGTRGQLQQLHERVLELSANVEHLTRAIPLRTTLRADSLPHRPDASE